MVLAGAFSLIITSGVQAGIATSGEILLHDGSDPWVEDELIFPIGIWSVGTLDIDGGSLVQTANTQLGILAGAQGTASLNGAGTTWNIQNGLVLGVAGEGVLNIENNATVNATVDTWLGYEPAGVGTINFNNGTLNTVGLLASPDDLQGTGSINASSMVSDLDLVFDTSAGLYQQFVLNNSPGQNITVTLDNRDPIKTGAMGAGFRGTGTLTITDGLTIPSGRGFLGYHAGSHGTATVTGPGSHWNNRFEMYVGYGSTGELNIENGGVVTDLQGAYVGYNAGSTGTVHVRGMDSRWLGGERHIGVEGLGTLLIEDGGHVSSQTSRLGSDQGGTGTAVVTGADSRWNVSGTLQVGRRAIGSLSVTNGGQVISTEGQLGSWAGSSGEATVSGLGSEWNITSRLQVGVYAEGNIEITDGASLLGYFGIIGDYPGSDGTVAVLDQGSTWVLTDDLYVGDEGNGTLNIENGGYVSNFESFVGINTGSVGTVTVTGAGSRWFSDNALHVGQSGTGVVNIENGGVVAVDSTTWIGSLGVVNLTDGTLMTRSLDLDGDPARLNWTGGKLHLTNDVIDFKIDSGATLGQNLAIDAGKTFQLDGGLVIGQSGSSTLDIALGGEVIVEGELSVNPNNDVSGSHINFTGGIINTTTLLVSPDDLLGAGTVNANALISDFDLVMDSSTGLQPQITLNSLPGQNITLNIDASALVDSGVMGAGYRGTGSMTLTDGLQLSNKTGYIGYFPNASGAASITGPGTEWALNEDLSVGRLGEGSLNIANGARVSNDWGYIGFSVGATGMAHVTGVGSTWDNNHLNIGVNGIGTLNIENGGVVNVQGITTVGSSGVVNFNLGTLNTNTITASSSALLGTGTINTVNVIGDFDLVFDEFSGLQGQALLSNLPGQNIIFNVDASLSDDTGTLGVGYEGVGSLTITDGLVLSYRAGAVGSYPGSMGTATVTGPGSTWNLAASISVGEAGVGVLNIQDGGKVVSGAALVGPEGVVNVTGVGSLWDNKGRINLGRFGGELNILDSGHVIAQGGIALWFSGTLNLEDGLLDLQGSDLTSFPPSPARSSEFNFTGGKLMGVGRILLQQPFNQLGGTLAPGESVGQTDIIGDYDLTAGTLELELGGPGNPHDFVTATGDIDIALTGTTLDLPALGAIDAGTYTVIESTAGTITGAFEHITGLGIHPGLIDVNYTANAVTVTLNWDYLPGDLDGDGFVGIDDLNTVLTAWNQNVTPGLLAAGDITGDGFIGIGDLTAVLANWNTGTPPSIDSINAVPEPMTAGLIGMGVLCWGHRRPRVRPGRLS